MKHVAILGSTGSIGRQALEVIAAHDQQLAVHSLACHSNDRLLETQIAAFKPRQAVLTDRAAYERLKERYQGDTEILYGDDGLTEIVSASAVDVVLASISGFAGLRPTVRAIEAGKDIALANKETMVAAGALVTALAKEKGSAIFPVDSEHSALWQCLQGEAKDSVQKLLLTASGGPFRGKKRSELETISVEACLRHPNWSMGRKVTVDSASLANKALEVMEAHWLFDIPYEQIEVVVHPESIIHSLIAFRDGAVKAQLGKPDMRLPIQYALFDRQRPASPWEPLDLTLCGKLTFEAPDRETFPMLDLGCQAGRSGGAAPCIFNAANEIAVEQFLDGALPFLAIPLAVEDVLAKEHSFKVDTLAEIEAVDAWARTSAVDACEKYRK